MALAGLNFFQIEDALKDNTIKMGCKSVNISTLRGIESCGAYGGEVGDLLSININELPCRKNPATTIDHDDLGAPGDNW